MWEITREQHFVPQVHLKKFTDHHDKKIFVYDKNFRKLNKKYHPVQICRRDYLYEFSVNNPNNWIENAFSYIEKKFTDLYENKLKHINHLNKNIKLSNDERLIILYYVLRMDYWNIVNKITWDEWMWNMWERNIIENCKTKEDLDIAYKNMHSEKKDSEQRRVPVQIKTIFDNFIPYLFKERIIMFILNKQENYLTSDNPVNNYYSKEFKPWGFYGPSVFDINYQIAVSQKLVICIDDDKANKWDGDIVLDSNWTSVFYMNSSYFVTANEFIYSPRLLNNNEIIAYKECILNNQQ